MKHAVWPKPAAFIAALALLGLRAARADTNYVCLVPARFNAAAAATNGNRAVLVDGIPFLKGDFWNPPEGGRAVIPLGDLTASTLYLLGGLNSKDECHPGWGGGNGFENFFFGSKTGDLRIQYASGLVDTIPLIMGYTSWIHCNYQISPEPFKSHPRMAEMLDRALCVANGLQGYKKNADAYFLVVRLRPQKVRAIELCDRAAKTGYFKVEGLSFGNAADTGSLAAASFAQLPGREMSETTGRWIAGHTIISSNGYPAFRRKAVERLRLKFDTLASDINYETIAQTPPEVTARDFEGPKVRFEGSPTAELMTRIYYENARQMLGRVDDNGSVHESAKGADNFNGLGTWTAGLGPFYDDSYTRIRALTLLSNLGFSKKADAAIDYYDHWMMYFPESFPRLQLGSQPVPAHATVIANHPLIYFDRLRKAGWPTKYQTHDFGNGENDGHGMLMLSRWRAWLKQGRTRAWVDRRWEVIKAAAEYIPWCLAHPSLSFSQHGLLYSESEGGMQMESMFCDLNCYLGLLGSIDMAKRTGREQWAKRWQQIADRYLQAMNSYYPATLAPWGEVWDPAKTADWGYHHATLAPVVIGMDYWGYDVMHKLPPGWKARTLRTYQMQLTKNAPPYAAPAGMGYGQCYITEAALLLDQMQDASRMVDWVAKFCFAPRLSHPYRVPEGAVVESDGSIWRRWGDLGNLYQLAEVEYTIQVILGIDDLDPRELVLMPRLPLDWTGIQVEDWPVRTFSGNHSQLLPLSVSEQKGNHQFTIILQSRRPIDKGRIRVGPFETSAGAVEVTRNGEPIAGRLFKSGDRQWVWVPFGKDDGKQIVINAVVP